MPLKKIFKLIYGKIPSFLRKPIYTIFSTGMKLVNPLIVLKLNKGKFLDNRIKKIDNINDAIEFVYSFQYLNFSIKIAQVKFEILKLLEILKNLKPKIVLEIGTAGGGTLFLFTRIAHPEATLISVDLPGGSFGGGYAKFKIPIYQSFTKDMQKIKLLRVDSHNPKTFELLKNILNNRMVDFLFIDGDHTYEGVKKDFTTYSSLVRKGGIIAFHDIVEHSPWAKCKVNRFWDEIKKDYEYLEIIKDRKQKWAGIGIFFL